MDFTIKNAMVKRDLLLYNTYIEQLSDCRLVPNANLALSWL